MKFQSFLQRLHQARAFHRDGLAFLFCVLAFVLFPDADVAFSHQWVDENRQFVFKQWPLVQWSYGFFAQAHWYVLGALALAASCAFYKKAHALKRVLLFLLLALVLGPGLLVNTVLKEYWGRPRPHAVQEFGGALAYKAPLQMGGDCNSNCSFVSGHASMGFYFMALAWALQRRIYLGLGLVLGLLVGLGRIVQGDHFLGDVLFAFWAVYFSCVLSAALLGLRVFKADAASTPPNGPCTP